MKYRSNMDLAEVWKDKVESGPCFLCGIQETSYKDVRVARWKCEKSGDSIVKRMAMTTMGPFPSCASCFTMSDKNWFYWINKKHGSDLKVELPQIVWEDANGIQHSEGSAG